ncbi:cytochrome b6-f complex iron-sulfur subunit [Striga asiatica]|uniref:Cytochrome b6-f complex iron-sulfur subunit n=1 Tax=Striga asiatica TaxID=4170 RepID=A0A5A7PYR0_STRAF|nr:cytochrome b6-f complex iron-sulfur subunit [Striga asiatica]
MAHSTNRLSRFRIDRTYLRRHLYGGASFSGYGNSSGMELERRRAASLWIKSNSNSDRLLTENLQIKTVRRKKLGIQECFANNCFPVKADPPITAITYICNTYINQKSNNSTKNGGKKRI